MDLGWSNSLCCHITYVCTNERLSNHDTVFLRYAVTKLNESDKQESNHFTTWIQQYNLKILTAEEKGSLNTELMLQDWKGVTQMTPAELQERITKNLENAVMKIA